MSHVPKQFTSDKHFFEGNLPLHCDGSPNSNDDEARNLKPQVFPFPNTLLMLLCLEKKDFLLITFLQLLWGYYDGLCTSQLPSVSLFAASKLKNFYNQHFRWRRLEAQLDFFHSIMPYINFAYVHR